MSDSVPQGGLMQKTNCVADRTRIGLLRRRKQMGRPINKDKIGFGEGRIAISRHNLSGSEATTAAHILRQIGDAKFVIRLDSNNDGGGPFSPRDHASDVVATLTTEANGSMPTASFRIDATGSDSTVYNVSKLRNRTVQVDGSAGGAFVSSAENAIYNIGFDASALEDSAVPNAVFSVGLPRQTG